MINPAIHAQLLHAAVDMWALLYLHEETRMLKLTIEADDVPPLQLIVGTDHPKPRVLEPWERDMPQSGKLDGSQL